MEICKKFVETVHKSMHEVINYFFDDPEKAKGILKLDSCLCPASYAMYLTLVEKEGFGNLIQDFNLKSCQFCKKAVFLLPRMFDMRAPIVVPRLKEIMQEARNGIDSMGHNFIQNSSAQSKPDYERYKRVNLLNDMRNYYWGVSQEELIERVKRRYTKNNYAKELCDKLSTFDDRDFDQPYQTEAKEISMKVAKIAQDEAREIEKTKANAIAFNEMQEVLDFCAFTYKGVVLAPSIVNMKGENPKIYRTDQEAVRREFQEKRDYIEFYRRDLYQGDESC